MRLIDIIKKSSVESEAKANENSDTAWGEDERLGSAWKYLDGAH